MAGLGFGLFGELGVLSKSKESGSLLKLSIILHIFLIPSYSLEFIVSFTQFNRRLKAVGLHSPIILLYKLMLQHLPYTQALARFTDKHALD